MIRDFSLLVLGITIGYCLVEGLAFVQHNYLWALFYH